MRILGIDYGEKRIGLAISDPMGIISTGVGVLDKGETFAEDISNIKKTISSYSEVSEIVLGLPKTMAGEIGHSAKKVLEFYEAMKSEFLIPIKLWDERLTTVSAKKFFLHAGVSEKKSRKIIDKTAATFILQNYLDSVKR